MTQLLSLILFFLLPLFTNPVHAAVVINELLPITQPATQEWIELYNNGSEQVSLDRWRLQNTAGEVKTFTLNASWIIAAHGFLTFTGSQTGISFSTGGDTVQLFDANNTQVDSQSFPGVLGYNNSTGRSSDGGGTWTPCTLATYNLPNNCPQPSPTPTPIPTNTPLPTATPQPTNIPIPISTTAPQVTSPSVVSPIENQTPNNINRPSSTPVPDMTDTITDANKLYASLIFLVVVSWGIIVGVAYIRRTGINNSEE